MDELHGHLLVHWALSALICKAATEAGTDPDRVKFKRTVWIVRRRAADPAAFPPDHQRRVLARVMADITRKKTVNPQAAAPHLPQGGQARPAQLLPRQEARR